jgi:hypothetical protein
VDLIDDHEVGLGGVEDVADGDGDVGVVGARPERGQTRKCASMVASFFDEPLGGAVT